MRSYLWPVAPYKGVFLLILIFVALEYLFSTVSDSQSALFNSTRQQSYYGPLLKTLLFKNNNLTVYPKNYSPLQPNFAEHQNFTDMTIPDRSSSDSTKDDEVVENSTEVPLCNDGTQYLYGRVEVVKDKVPAVSELEERFSLLKPGGHWEPEHCRVEKKVAIIVPYRNRGEHLLLFLQHMHPFLQRQQLDYSIFVVEQDGEGSFNRAMLFNIGYVEALKIRHFDCFIFHDIDLLPEDDRNLYNCPEQPRHMSVAVDFYKYKIPYSAIFGGVSALTTEHFKLLNGFSNTFWGWGGEDDDMSNRIRYHKLHISRYPITIARYTMLSHKRAKASPTRFDMLKKGLRLFDKEGLVNLKYELINKKQKLLYTWFLAKIEPPKS